MIITKMIWEICDFESIQKGDFLAVEWKLDSYIGDKRTRFAVYKVIENKKKSTEIILQRKNNVYFNYSLFCGVEDGCSNAKSVMLIKQTETA